ncbi:hypothetical protein E2C01_015670 [Portunus trituberculatus]|uniref:Uncharacterized protein n=1 Tax=Portunus trituberculatus TaxID=210409 RepID=A0A5B7DMG5_PORTR|nr:hypothetical protein [Portunus trituberculatus]
MVGNVNKVGLGARLRGEFEVSWGPARHKGWAAAPTGRQFSPGTRRPTDFHVLLRATRPDCGGGIFTSRLIFGVSIESQAASRGPVAPGMAGDAEGGGGEAM